MTERDTQRPAAPDAPDTREKILGAALDEFTRHGLAGARVDRIAAAAGVNKAMLYYYFSSKENLYRQSLREFLGARVRTIHQCLAEAQSLEEALGLIADMYAELFAKHADRVKLFARELADPEGPIVQSFVSMARETQLPERVRRVFEAEVAAGRLRQVDLVQAFISFVTMNIGYFLMSPIMDQVWRIEDRERFVAERRRAVVDLFMNGVRAR